MRCLQKVTRENDCNKSLPVELQFKLSILGSLYSFTLQPLTRIMLIVNRWKQIIQ